MIGHLKHGISRVVILDIDLHHGTFAIRSSFFNLLTFLQAMVPSPLFGRSTRSPIARRLNPKVEHLTWNQVLEYITVLSTMYCRILVK